VEPPKAEEPKKPLDALKDMFTKKAEPENKMQTPETVKPVVMPPKRKR